MSEAWLVTLVYYRLIVAALLAGILFVTAHSRPCLRYLACSAFRAALDFKNVSIVANYIKERTRDAQFVIISLRNNMFELADRLVGIYKTRDVTKSVTINPTKIAARCGVASGQEQYRVSHPGPGAPSSSAAAAGAGAGSSRGGGGPLAERAPAGNVPS